MKPGTVISLVVVTVIASGCATRSYVDEQVAGLQSQVDAQGAQLDQLTTTAREALARAEDAGVLAQGKFLYTVAFTEDDIRFATDESSLDEGAESRLASLADQLKADNRNVYLEIQGYTDATGPETYNQQLGLARAESVRRALHAQGVALDRMATISYGKDAPVADNGSAEGRAQNRRVEVVVLN